MAKSLQQARQETAQRLEENMAQSRNELGLSAEESASALLVWIDYKKLRGLPCFAKGTGGVVTDSFVPGSDEHLDQIDAA